MGKFKRMDQVRTIIRTYLNTTSIRATAQRLQISKNTVKHYVRIGKAFNEDLSQLLLLEDPAFIAVFYPSKNTEAEQRLKLFKSKIDYWVEELKRIGVTRYLLWEEYLEEHPNGYSYSQFCEHFKREIGRRDLTIALDHEPGQVMQVDFAGKKMRWVDL